MSGREQPNRFNAPAAGSLQLEALLRETQRWITLHGYVFLDDCEIYGMATQGKDDDIEATEYMAGTGAVRYSAGVSQKTVDIFVPTASARTLDVQRGGLIIEYREPYYYLPQYEDMTPADEWDPETLKRIKRLDASALEFTGAQLLFDVAGPPGTNTFTHYKLFAEEEGGASGSFYRPHTPQIAPDGSVHNDIKRHECNALRKVVRALGEIAQERRQGRSFARSYSW